ncbi:anti-sigma factor RsbA family regulatory protein [Nonomuraea sp. NPDC050227]|uniref:anti-sigma factor RsbA family regulatory protein n=1 Tax=Nonomuraea sp. NPDC050227 TaxID=3364360 RepID=UPI0037B12C38
MRRERAQSLKHVAVPYDSDRAFLDLVVPRVRTALDEDRRVLVVTRPDRLALLAEALDGDARRIDSRPAGAWYGHPHRMLAAYHEYTRGRPTLVVGEPVWTDLSEPRIQDLIRYDSVVNAALAAAPSVMLCLYDLRDVPEPVRELTPVVHPLVLGAGGEAASGRFVQPHELVLDGDDAPFPEPGPGACLVRFTARELKRLRQTVGDYARTAGMDRNLISSLVLSVSEIAANCVEHGAGFGTITMWVEERDLVCEIADPGGALDDPLPGYIPPEPESPRGYGLWISRQLCDRVQLRDEGGLLRVRLRLSLDSP